MTFTVRAIESGDGTWVRAFIEQRWGMDMVVAHGDAVRPSEHPGFVAEDGEERVGLVTYRLDSDGGCEVVTIDSLAERKGVGTALLAEVVSEAHRSGCRRVWLITTNDNLDALRFYQRRGFRLVGLRPDAVQESRKLKPEISEIGDFGIPIRDD